MIVNIGKGLTVEVNDIGDDFWYTEKMRPVADFVWRMGWHNILMDSHAGVTRESVLNGEPLTDEQITEKVKDQSLAVALKKLDALMRGELRVNRESVERDPVATEARRIAVRDINAALKATGTPKPSKEKMAEAIKSVSTREKVIAEAKRIVRLRTTNVEAVDLAELGL